MKGKKQNRRPLTPFGVEVKQALAQKDMTAAELAEQVGISRQYLTALLHEQHRRAHREAIVTALDLPEKWLSERKTS